jgi:hypothetical protein
LKTGDDRRHTITKGFAIVQEQPILRHFTVDLERVKSHRPCNNPNI